jgi:hypothetical protein
MREPRTRPARSARKIERKTVRSARSADPFELARRRAESDQAAPFATAGKQKMWVPRCALVPLHRRFDGLSDCLARHSKLDAGAHSRLPT